MKNFYLTRSLFLVLLISATNKIAAQSLPVVTTDTTVIIQSTSANVYGEITNDGGDPNVVGGFCYSTSSPNPTISDSITGDITSGAAVFFTTIAPLLPNTNYYVRAYATNVVGTVYGSSIQFITDTCSLPVVTTDSITTITGSSATGYGTLISKGNDQGTNAGLCYSTAPNPTIANSISISYFGGDTLLYNTMLELTANTIYYVRYFATNAAGTAYGSQIQFSTTNPTMPAITTDSIVSVTGTTADGYCRITDDGGDHNITAGFCYSTSPNPTIMDSSTIKRAFDTITIQYFYDYPFKKLIPNTTYYARAFATTMAGTSYGDEMQFTTGNATLPVVTTDSVNVFYNYAEGDLNVVDDGNDPHVIHGFCYNTSPNPTLADSVSIDYIGDTDSTIFYIIGEGPGYADMYHLKPNTTYYARAFATNVVGTSYGTQLQFSTTNCFAYYVTTYDSIQNTFTITVDSLTSKMAKSYFWNFGDGATSTDRAPSHNYATDGVYTVCMEIYTASGESCSFCNYIGIDSSGNIYRTSGFSMTVVNPNNAVASIPQNSAGKNSFTIMPNPTSNKINVVFNEAVNEASVMITTITGQKIIEYNNLNGNKFSFDLSDQASGIYILEINQNGTIARTKLIKQ